MSRPKHTHTLPPLLLLAAAVLGTAASTAQPIDSPSPQPESSRLLLAGQMDLVSRLEK